jgi:tetratricopeptide (TPR) repeat protein
VAAVVVVFALGLAAVRAQAASDTREIKAREDFAAGRFQEALDIFARLYAESLHPIYLRNIGRCYQGLQNPDRAIATFRDYLRKAKGITPDE